MLFQGVSNDAEGVPALLEQGEAGGLHSVQRERMQVKWVKGGPQLHTSVESFLSVRSAVDFGLLGELNRTQGGCTLISHSEWAPQEESVSLSTILSGSECLGVPRAAL